jgi:uncharacterized protein
MIAAAVPSGAAGGALALDTPVDTPLRGQLRRADKIMTPQEARSFIAQAYCGRIGTLGRDGFPYVVPNLFVWMEERIYLHTAKQSGHFLANVQFNPRACFEVDEPGETFPYGPVECDTSIAYRSAVVFGNIAVVSDRETKLRFFAAFMSKYAPAESWGRPKDSFPRVDATIVYALQPDVLSGKQTPLPAPAQRWRGKG